MSPQPARSTPVPSATHVQELCTDAAQTVGTTGAQVAVAFGPHIVHAEYGIANWDLGEPVRPDTVFQIGSTTKLFTATLVLQLADLGVVDIDRPVADHLPGVRLTSDASARRITPRQLMAMCSGIDNGPYLDTGRGDDSLADYVDLLGDIPPIFEPGATYGYSNASTVVSGRLVERTRGSIFERALHEHILEPAGLTEAVTLFEELPYHRVAVGHFPDEPRSHRPWSTRRGAAPSGSTLAMSARDLVRFGRILLEGGVADTGMRILSAEAVRTMHTPQVAVPARVFADAWAVGPYLRRWGPVDVFGHGGTTPNGSSTLVWIPELGVALATIVNTPSSGYEFADRIIDVLLRDGLSLAKPPRPEVLEGRVDPAGLVGDYVSFGRHYRVESTGERLMITVRGINYRSSDAEPGVRTALLPIAPDRFLPEDDAATLFHRWDFAFTRGRDGQATLLHNGAFAARRVSGAP